MAQGRVLVVAATHGNERNAPWLLEHWHQQPGLLTRHGLELQLVVGHPQALAANTRYLDRDLNRSFSLELLADASRQEHEIQRARALLAAHGPGGTSPCAVVFDLHSTTSAMGNALVVYGRRPADLALAAGIQARLGLPVYLHEADPVQTGFLVERWPCGLVIEVGPVPQGLVSAPICRQTQLALEAGLDTVAAAAAGRLRLPRALTLHVHVCSVDLPRRADGTPASALHPHRQHRDWQPLEAGDPLFWSPDGGTQGFVPSDQLDPAARWPVFINEAAYGEKGIALSLTRRERLACEGAWAEALTQLVQRGVPL